MERTFRVSVRELVAFSFFSPDILPSTDTEALLTGTQAHKARQSVFDGETEQTIKHVYQIQDTELLVFGRMDAYVEGEEPFVEEIKHCKDIPEEVRSEHRAQALCYAAMLAEEKAQLYPLPGYPFDPCKRTTGRVDRFCTIRFDTNNYSVSVSYCGREVSVKASPELVSIYYGGQCIAKHHRCHERKQYIYSLEHYLPILEKKGRAVFYAKPVQETLPEYFTQWLQRQNLSPKEIVEILYRCKDEEFETIMTEAPCHTTPVPIEDSVVVQAVDLQIYDAFLRGKAGSAV